MQYMKNNPLRFLRRWQIKALKRTTNQAWRGLLFVLGILFPMICVICQADDRVTLAWDPNPEPDVNAYLIYYGTNSRAYPYSTNVGNITRATVYGLSNGITWYFALTAQNTAGLESDFSSEVVAAFGPETNTTPTIATIPNVTMRQNGFTNVTAMLWDVETNPALLTVIAGSSNPGLIPVTGITITGTNHLRNVHLLPNPLQSGQTLITLIVSDGTNAASTSFTVTVVPIPQAPSQMMFVTKLQVSDAPTGPWTTVFSSSLPVDITGSTGRFYRTWLDVTPVP